MDNLLSDPLIRYRQSHGTLIEASLPEIYAALMADDVEAFPALRPHQRHAWHAFLVQLGVMAMQWTGLDAPATGAEEWRRIIRVLTLNYPDDEPWQLVVEDITKPAFMQPPASAEERRKDFKNRVATPDDLDMLVTAKNHDLKSEVAEQARKDDWIFALITLQTMEGYGGRYNYGISRMPSGYGNRPAFSLTPSDRPGSHVYHDLNALLKGRPSVLDEYHTSDSGIPLLWVIPWDGTKAEPRLLTEMDPYYIEVSRRVRLFERSGKLVAVRANSDDRRIVDSKGLTGDPWAPVSNNSNPRGTPPAFLGTRRFGYERLVDGLFSADWKQPLLLSRATSGQSSGGDMQLVARGMVRGEGGTEGYHERIIPLRHRTLQIFGRPGGAKELEDVSRERIERIAVAQRILRHAVSVFAAGGKTEGIADEHRTRANPWANKLTEFMDADFFEDMQREAAVEDSQRRIVRQEWLRKLVDRAEGILSDATQSLPCTAIHRPKAEAQAQNVFWARIRGPNGLTELRRNFDEEDAEWQKNDQPPQTNRPAETSARLSQ